MLPWARVIVAHNFLSNIMWPSLDHEEPRITLWGKISFTRCLVFLCSIRARCKIVCILSLHLVDLSSSQDTREMHMWSGWNRPRRKTVQPRDAVRTAAVGRLYGKSRGQPLGAARLGKSYQHISFWRLTGPLTPYTTRTGYKTIPMNHISTCIFCLVKKWCAWNTVVQNYIFISVY